GGTSESTYMAKFVLKPGGDDKSFLLDSVPNGNEKPADVDLALDAGKPIKQHFIGQIWLPPAARQINANTRTGDIQEMRPKWNRWAVFVVEGYGATKGQFFFEANTGFLVGANIPTSAGTQSAVLTTTSIAGL